jgi:hypothetical protein
VSLLGVENWLKIPPDRDVIARWTVHPDKAMQHSLAVPPPANPDQFEFLVLGDSGDADASGPRRSPQEAVAAELAADAALPGSSGRACMLLHVGDVIYMTGERRLYDRNFRRPYAPFLTGESTVDRLVFRLPFLPVPGNHDYYDLGGWGMALSRLPLLGAGLRAIAHELFAFSLPEGGSGMGKAYMQAFVDPDADTTHAPLPYRPGEQTRLPNRYYRFRVGLVDFFALDSNTLDGPPPSIAAAHVRADAAERVRGLEARARVLDRELRRDQLALDRWRAGQREAVAADPVHRASLAAPAAAVTAALAGLEQATCAAEGPSGACIAATEAAARAHRRWSEATADLADATEPVTAVHALEALEEASDEGCAALRELEGCLAELPEGPARERLLATRFEVERAIQEWQQRHRPEPLPEKLCARLHRLSEEALDVQQELARERQRRRHRPEDYDVAQIHWLDASLAEAEHEQPDGWRIVYLHHPLYSTIANHCEHPDIQSVRENLMSVLRGRVHLVLSGHSHAFEWLRSDALPCTGLFVTGGGGQLTLRSSILEAPLLHRQRDRYDALRRAGVVECAAAGRGPAASDGEAGSLYHYLQVQVSPEVLSVRPIGVRRTASGYRREAPMPVYHAPVLPETRPRRRTRRLEAVEIRRDQPPRPRWG